NPVCGPPIRGGPQTPQLLLALRHVEVRQLLGESEVRAAVAADVLQVSEILVHASDREAAERVAVGQPELGRELVVIEQARLVDPARERLGGLDLDPPATLQAG